MATAVVIRRSVLSDGDAVCVVEMLDGEKQVEIVGKYDSQIETAGGHECIRFPVRTDDDVRALLEAIREARASSSQPPRTANR